MPDVVKGIGWLVFLSIVIVILSLVVVIFVVNNCCGVSSVAVEPAVKLVVEDAHSGVWMPFDNGWTKGGSIKWTKWDGLVIQLGEFFKYNTNGDRAASVEFSSIKFENDTNGQVVLLKDDFDWINIVSDHPSSWEAPIKKDQGYLLFPNQISPSLCDVVDSCPDTSKLPNPPAANCQSNLKLAPQPCMRMRSLHSTFEPYAVVTYWQGPSGYSLAAEQNATDCNRFSFGLEDPIDSVQVFKAGSPVVAKQTAIANLGTITKITIAMPTDTPHEEMEEPPMTGGSRGP